jgi:mannose-6-phosphate isomerase-like protein (cupin superfamily)
MIKTDYEKITAYQTKDGSIIRELLHPDVHGMEISMSLAEAIVPAGEATLRHLHEAIDEIYHITSGKGLLTLGEESVEIRSGDTIYIPCETPHQVKNTGYVPLKILCICVPPYTHEKTILL